MTDLGSDFHGLLGWTLLCPVIGHIAAAIWHYRSGQQAVLLRMAAR